MTMARGHQDADDELHSFLLEEYKDEEADPSYAQSSPRSKRATWNEQILSVRGHVADNSLTIWKTLRPQWLRPHQERKIHPTSWLDGLRGIACLFVVLHHSSRYISDLRGAVRLDIAHMLEFPIISVVVAGTSMVDVFFIVSGYCLSYKALRAARLGNTSNLLADLSSSTFRRAIRLFGPCMVASLLFALLSWAGYEVRSPREGTLLKQLWAWISAFVQDINPYRIVLNTGAFRFGDIFWTISAEFRGSLHVFLTLLALGRAKDSVRLAGLILLEIYFSLTGRWDILLFHSGILCCELHLLWENWFKGRPPSTALPSISSASPTNRSRLRHLSFLIPALNSLVCLFSVFLMGRQHDSHDFGRLSPLYKLSDWGSPRSWIDAEPGEQRNAAGRPVIVFGACLFILQVDNFVPKLKKWIFERRFVQYLGEISYCAYLLHSQLLDTIGDACFHWVWSIFEKTIVNTKVGDEKRWVSLNTIRLFWWMLTVIVLFGPILCWACDIATRTLDRGSIRFARYMENKCIRS